MAYEYRLHRTIRGDEASDWVELGHQLFAPAAGLVGEFLTRPSVKHGHVMLTGFAVLGLRFGPMHTNSMVTVLAPVMSRNTILARVERLMSVGVVECEGKTVSTTPNWNAVLDEYDLGCGLADFATKQDRIILDERERWHAKDSGRMRPRRDHATPTGGSHPGVALSAHSVEMPWHSPVVAVSRLLVRP